MTALDVIIKSIEEGKYHEDVLLYLINYTKIGITLILFHFNVLNKIFRSLSPQIQFEVLSCRVDPITQKECFRMGTLNCVRFKIINEQSEDNDNLNGIEIHNNFKIADLISNLIRWLKENILN